MQVQPPIAQAPDWLAPTKLSAPPPRPNLVERARLVERLETGLRGPLTVIAAPAGFGKTTLLLAWRASPQGSDRALAWLALEEADNDPIRFWRGVIAAFQVAGPGVGHGALALLHPTQSLSDEVLVATLMGELADLPTDVVLVLEDYHVIVDEAVHRQLAMVLDRPPPGLHVVITSRADPPLPLARLRARAQLAEIGALELRFTSEETTSFLSDTMELELLPEQVTALGEATEGWPAGLQLAALALRGRADPTHFIATFAGTHRYVVDYLVEEVLQQQPLDVQMFLAETAILDRLSGPLCEAVTERSGGAAMLGRIDQANLFLVPLDEERRWYRYHHLFAEVLRDRLAQLTPAEVPELHGRASAWYQANNFPAEAIEHALAAGNASRVADLVELVARPMMWRGEVALLRRWLASLPAEIVRARPRLVLAQAWALVANGRAEEAEACLRDMLAQPDGVDATRPDSLPEAIRGEVAALRAHVASRTHDWSQAVALAEQALAQVPQDDRTVRAFAALTLGTARRFQGDWQSAVDAFTPAAALGEAGGDLLMAVYGTDGLAKLHAARGELHRAARVYEQALALATNRDGKQLPAAGLAHAGLGKVFREWGALDNAERHLEQAIDLGRRSGLDGIVVDSTISLALVASARGEFERGFELLRQSAHMVRGWRDSANAVRVRTFEARLHLTQGNVAEAVRWSAESGIAGMAVPNEAQEIELTTLARVRIAQGRIEPSGPWLQEASSLLGRMLTGTEAGGRMGQAIEIRALLALAAEAAGDPDTALLSLGQAMAMAEPEGNVRTFVDEGAPMAGLVAALLTSRRAGKIHTPRPSPEYLERLLAAFGASAGSPPKRVHPPRPSGSPTHSASASRRCCV